MKRTTFSPSEMFKLKAEFGKIERASIDCLDAVHAIFDKCHPQALIQLAKADIKFISMLARNACSRNGLKY